MYPSSSKQTLRYCPKCISLGFLSASFQMPWIRICPIHRVELVDGCPSCDAHIPYRCDWETLTFAYGCSDCGTALWTDRDTLSSTRTLSDQELAVFSKSFFDEKSLNTGLAHDRALFCLRPTPFQTSDSADVLSYVPAFLLQAVGTTSSEIDVYARSGTHVHDCWDVREIGKLGTDAVTSSSGFHPQYRTLLPRNLKPCWRTKVRSDWVEVESESWGMNFLQQANYIQEGFRKFAKEELFSAHKECFQNAVNCEAALKGEAFECCPWVIAVDNWERDWEAMGRRGATSWGYANLKSSEVRKRKGRSAGSIWASDAMNAFWVEFNCEINDTLRKSCRGKNRWSKLFREGSHESLLRRDVIRSTNTIALVYRFLSFNLLETLAISCAAMDLLVDNDGAPVPRVDDAFFVIICPEDSDTYRPKVHIWQRNLMTILRDSSQAGCKGKWVRRSLSLPLSKSSSDFIMNS